MIRISYPIEYHFVGHIAFVNIMLTNIIVNLGVR